VRAPRAGALGAVIAAAVLAAGCGTEEPAQVTDAPASVQPGSSATVPPPSAPVTTAPVPTATARATVTAPAPDPVRARARTATVEAPPLPQGATRTAHERAPAPTGSLSPADRRRLKQQLKADAARERAAAGAPPDAAQAREIHAAFDAVTEAVAAREWKAVCAALLPATRTELLRSTSRRACPEAVATYAAGLGDARFGLAELRVKGDRAQGTNPRGGIVVLRRVDGRWLLASSL